MSDDGTVTRYVGIDPSLTRTGVAILETGLVTPISITSSNKTRPDVRLFRIVSEVSKYLKHGDVVVFEDFGFGGRFNRNSGKLIERLELLGMLKLRAMQITHLPILTALPSWIKKFLIARGSRVSKDDIVKEVRERWCISVANDDEADASGLALLACAALGGPLPVETCLRKPQSKAVQDFLEINKFAIARMHVLRTK